MGQPPKSPGRWLRASLIAGGVLRLPEGAPVPLDLAWDVAEILVQTKRTVPCDAWDPERARARAMASLAALD